MKSSKPASLLFVGVIYVLAFLAARHTLSLLEYGLIWNVLLADIVATVIVFIGSVAVKNSSMYDPYWSVAPVPIAYYVVHVSGIEPDLRTYLILGVVWFWAIRLTLNWARGWPGLIHEDWRYRDLAKKHGKWYWAVSFSGIHLLPTVFVFLGCLPLFVMLPSSAPVGLFDYLGAAIAIVGTLLELIADEQMRAFKRTAKSDEVMTLGIWKNLRHPNYLGELLFWLGLFVFTLSSVNSTWWTGVGILAMVCLFVFISIPMMDRHHLEKRPGYADIMARTRALIPLGK